MLIAELVVEGEADLDGLSLGRGVECLADALKAGFLSCSGD